MSLQNPSIAVARRRCHTQHLPTNAANEGVLIYKAGHLCIIAVQTGAKPVLVGSTGTSAFTSSRFGGPNDRDRRATALSASDPNSSPVPKPSGSNTTGV